MKNILIYMPSFGGGGAERNGALLASEFSRIGHKVLVVVDNIEGPNRGLLSKTVDVCQLETASHKADLLALRRVIRKFGPDLLYARVGLSPIKALIAAFGLISWNKIIISYHNPYDSNAQRGGLLKYQFASLLTRLAGVTITVSNDIRNELINRFWASGKKIHVVHNPVGLNWIEKQSSEKNSYWLTDRKYILSVGRLINQKDFPTLIRAFSEISRKTDHDLIIIGEGPLRQSLESLIRELQLKDRIHMPGYIENPFPIYRDADLFVLSSIFEGFGNVIVEALALGIPVVATWCPGGPKEILDEGRYGCLVPVGDCEALAEAMLATLDRPPNPEILRNRAKEFSVENIAAEYLRVVK